MAILVISRVPGGDKPPSYDQISQQLLGGGNRPDGMILHAAGDNGGTFEIYDVFESREKYEAFLDDVLRPAVKDVLGDEAFAAMPHAERVVVELDDLTGP